MGPALCTGDISLLGTKTLAIESWEQLISFPSLCSQLAGKEDFTHSLCLSELKHPMMARKEVTIPSINGETEAQGVREGKGLQDGTNGGDRNVSDDLSQVTRH